MGWTVALAVLWRISNTRDPSSPLNSDITASDLAKAVLTPSSDPSVRCCRVVSSSVLRWSSNRTLWFCLVWGGGGKWTKLFPENLLYFSQKTTGKVGKSRLKCFPIEFPLVFCSWLASFCYLEFSVEEKFLKKIRKPLPGKITRGFLTGKLIRYISCYKNYISIGKLLIYDTILILYYATYNYKFT